MSQKNSTLRIDEILLRENIVTEEQVRAALEYQREHGGRLGSHLIHLGYVDEADLCAALSRQFNCESINLSGLTIAPEVTAMFPADVAVARTVIPFDYDPKEDLLSIACEDPTDSKLFDELSFVAGGRKIKLFVAAASSLQAAIAQCYGRGTPSSPYVAGSAERSSGSEESAVSPSGAVLLVSDEQEADTPLRLALERENFHVVGTESADDAKEIIDHQNFDMVFVRDTVQGDYIDLIDCLRKISPQTKVRYYESPAKLLLDEKDTVAVGDLVLQNLQLFTSLLSSRGHLADNHAGTVGHYVDKLCSQMGIPDRDRLTITNAAYLHDVSRYYYGDSEEAPDCRTRVSLTAKLLDSLNYSPLVIGMLRSMYINLQQKFTRRLPIETLGGNILTIVDAFYENVPVDTKMSLDRFGAIKNNFNALAGKLFLPEVVEAFTGMIEGEMLVQPATEKYNQILIYCDQEEMLESVGHRLRDDGFRPVAVDSLDRFADLYQRSRPDMMILLEKESADKAISLVDNLIGRGVEILKVPTFLLTAQDATTDPAALFERGIEDIIPIIGKSLDLLVVKMRKLRARAENKAREREEVIEGASDGKLEEMNLIDLLQSLGPSGKTAKVRVISKGVELVLYFREGDLVFAEGSGRAGVEAVHEGFSWTTGKWHVMPVSPDDLPEPNVTDSNESILSEGCWRLHGSRGIPTA